MLQFRSTPVAGAAKRLMGVVHMEKSIHLEVNTRRILRFVAEGRHRKSARSVVDAHSALAANVEHKPKPVMGVFSYSYTVSYKWLTPATALDPSRNSALAAPCPCGSGM